MRITTADYTSLPFWWTPMDRRRRFITQLLVVSVENRLGSVASAAHNSWFAPQNAPDEWHQICSHPFFGPIDFTLLERRQVQPPYVPRIATSMDTSYFDDFDEADADGREEGLVNLDGTLMSEGIVSW